MDELQLKNVETIQGIDPTGRYVLTCDRKLSSTEVETLRQAWKKFIEAEPGQYILILHGGLKLQVVEAPRPTPPSKDALEAQEVKHGRTVS